jgi:hypothetical protein
MPCNLAGWHIADRGNNSTIHLYLRTVMTAFLKRTILLWCALALLVLGSFLLATGDMTASPLLLVCGYCVLLPLFLWRSFRRGSGE